MKKILCAMLGIIGMFAMPAWADEQNLFDGEYVSVSAGAKAENKNPIYVTPGNQYKISPFQGNKLKSFGATNSVHSLPGKCKGNTLPADNERVGCFAFPADDCTLHGRLPCAEPAAQDHGFLRKNAQIAGPLASGGTGNRPVGKRQRAAYSGLYSRFAGEREIYLLRR